MTPKPEVIDYRNPTWEIFKSENFNVDEGEGTVSG